MLRHQPLDASSWVIKPDILKSHHGEVVLTSQLEQLAGRGRPAYNFIRLVGSRVDESKSMHREVLSMMRQVFGGSMTQSVMVTSAEIDNASSRMKTVFELDKPVTSHEVYNRCMKHLSDVCQDIEQDVLRTWASRAGGRI